MKFGKPIISISEVKEFLIDENDELIDGDKEINEIYKKQPKRDLCKNCEFPITNSDFRKQGIDYSICTNCGHLNGFFEDTDAFCSVAYQGTGTVDYQKNYSEEDLENFYKRVDNIYRPKAKFLVESLKKDKALSDNLKFTDIGAGLGYFISALIKENCKKVEGYEVSRKMSKRVIPY